jgi:valyl-tRNA synthetase
VVVKLGQLVAVIDQLEEEGQPLGSFRVGQSEFFIPINEAVDPLEERKKLTQELEYAKGFLKSVEKKLSNERFVSNAPEKVIELERKKAADAQDKIDLLEKSLSQL